MHSASLYFVAIVADERVEEEVHRFKSDLHERFGTKSALKAPAHVTLVPPFHFDAANETELSNALQQAASSLPAFTIHLNGFDRFSPSVLFVHVEENDALTNTAAAVQNVFTALPGIPVKKAEQNFHPHITVGNRDWIENGFETAWKEYSAKKYETEFPAEKISLLRLEDGRWKSVSAALMK